jgi:DNA polymerase-2
VLADSHAPGGLAAKLEYTGWLLDLFAGAPTGLVLWLLGDDGLRHRLAQPLPVVFYAAGPAARLRAAWRFLANQPEPVRLRRGERRDLFSSQPVRVLEVEVQRAAAQPRLFQDLARAFPDLTYYDADIALALRYAAVSGAFPLARCRVEADEAGQVLGLTVLDSPWELAPLPPPLRVMALEPDTDPSHAPPTALRVTCERFEYHLTLAPARALLIGLRAILQRHDPDLLLTAWGDTWLLPYLLELERTWRLPLPLNREAGRSSEFRRERSYFSYGQIVYQGRQVHLFGRWHVDRHNAMLFHDFGLDGVLEMARVTALPLQTAARVSPGTGISSMQILTALRNGILVPWHKQQAERPKSALDLLRADMGGLVYQPKVGLHRDVAEIDFVSMYPGIMVQFNISPEVVGSSEAIARAARRLHPQGEEEAALVEAQAGEGGLIPQTLRPLLNKRLALKAQLAVMPTWHPDYKLFKARSSAHKWLLVTCFGYLGYKNARFGRIEAHEAVTAYGREALLRAKDAAEDLGFSVLHLYVDGMWVRKPGAARVADFQPLLNEIVERTGLPVALDGIYRWVAFLPSRQDARVPVPNRYFGVFQDGSLKVRGIEARRRDTPAFVAQTQLEVLELLAQQKEGVPFGRVVDLLRGRLARLRAGQVPPQELLVAHRLSRVLEAYRARSPAARAVAQLEAAGKLVSPGQRVRFLYMRGEPGIHAWNLPQPPDRSGIDVDRYAGLLLRAAAGVLEPFGISEAGLRQWVLTDSAVLALPGLLPVCPQLPPEALPAVHPARLPAQVATQAQPVRI